MPTSYYTKTSNESGMGGGYGWAHRNGVSTLETVDDRLDPLKRAGWCSGDLYSRNDGVSQRIAALAGESVPLPTLGPVMSSVMVRASGLRPRPLARVRAWQQAIGAFYAGDGSEEDLAAVKDLCERLGVKLRRVGP